MQEEERKRQELLGFIKWKLENDKEFYKESLPEIKEMDLATLTRWAIRHDIIDA